MIAVGSLLGVVERVRATSKRTEKIQLLAQILRGVRGKEAELAAMYLSGALPQGRVGIGWSAIRSALTDAPRAGEPLALVDVDETLQAIAADGGSGSTERKARALRTMMERASPAERRFLAELLSGELRQGALDGVVLEAIAQAADLPAAHVRQARMFAGGIGEVARTALEEGAAGLSRYQLQVLRPVEPMLASPAADVAEVIERLGEAAFEYKLDGARIQVHKSGDSIRVFTRQLQDVTDRVPEVVEAVAGLRVPEVVLDGEAIALRVDGRPHPFQVTMRRFGRSKEVVSARAELPLSPFFFDCLFVDGAGSLVARPYAERFGRLREAVDRSEHLPPRIVTADRGEAERFLRQSLDAGHEGLMAKSLTAAYVAGQRGFSWLKLKSAHTLDLVVLAVEWGSGRRKGLLSNLHLGARDPSTGGFVMLGKTFKGLTDEMLRWQTERLLGLESRRDDWTVHVRPELVVEIAFSDVQESPRYPAGLALRFARVKRHRPDKRAHEADTLDMVKEIFLRQRR